MSALTWEVEEWTAPIRPLRVPLRLVPDVTEPVMPVAAEPIKRVTQQRITTVAQPAWELTRRGMAIALTGLAVLMGSAASTLVWGFLQISNAPLP
jgi:hypothetical protein